MTRDSVNGGISIVGIVEYSDAVVTLLAACRPLPDRLVRRDRVRGTMGTAVVYVGVGALLPSPWLTSDANELYSLPAGVAVCAFMDGAEMVSLVVGLDERCLRRRRK
mmetsp:Transcript_1957/g.6193  ORF Transcript_1957/g.6193 Transcript_1957/m.6193 type:complete len:107 (+) Transcript_1957:267-587(+)